MIIVGLTGSVGTGKTEISKYLTRNKISVFESDKHVRKIHDKKTIQEKLFKAFPEAISEKKINRRTLAEIVFNDQNKLNKLENIIHTELNKVQKKWIKKKLTERKKIVVLDVPLLFEKDNLEKYDLKILLTCSRNVQRIRVIKRKDWDVKRYDLTVSKQMSELEKKVLADKIIHTDRGKRYALSEINTVLCELKYKKHRLTSSIIKEFN
ncbi:MAG: dephospho-CoA kinase [Rickettsiales bacterium]|nr:dephospho-CoA kinase [Rickettsiales bacterium]|tara:strand:+ start:339 stop:965 length:627 start_codon:yes stop_codon:yes gene_type:complete